MTQDIQNELQELSAGILFAIRRGVRPKTSFGANGANFLIFANSAINFLLDAKKITDKEYRECAVFMVKKFFHFDGTNPTAAEINGFADCMFPQSGIDDNFTDIRAAIFNVKQQFYYANGRSPSSEEVYNIILNNCKFNNMNEKTQEDFLRANLDIQRVLGGGSW